MKVNQIKDVLNYAFGEILGETGLIEDNLSNIVEAGQVITSTTQFLDNFDNYTGRIIDKVGRTIFWDRVYKADDLGIWRDSFEFGSVLEKIRCDVGEYEDNNEWSLVDWTDADRTTSPYNGVSDANLSARIEKIFKFYPAKTQAKYFNGKTTFRTTISITQKQLREAFRSAADMAKFIGMIENRIRTKLEISKNQLQKMTLANLMAEHLYQKKQIIDLKAVYTTEVGGTVPATLKQALADGRATRFIGQKMAFYREMMAEPSKLYSATGTFYNHTPIEDSRLVVLADLDSALQFNVYGDTYNEEYVKLDNYKVVPFWQTSGQGIDDSLDVRSGIKVITSGNHTVTSNNIVGLLFDRDGAMICNEEPDVRTSYNPDGNFTNFFYCADCSYYNDFDENAIVFVWGDSTVVNPVLAKGSTGKTVVQATGITIPASGSCYGIVGDKPVEIPVGTDMTGLLTDWTALTLGTTALSATEGQYVSVIVLDSDDVVVDFGSRKATSAVIG